MKIATKLGIQNRNTWRSLQMIEFSHDDKISANKIENLFLELLPYLN